MPRPWADGGLQTHVLAAVDRVDRLMVIDNTSSARALRDVMLFQAGELVWAAPKMPHWYATMFDARLHSH